MATILLPLIAGTLPSGACFASEQERLNAFMAVSNAQLDGGMAFYNYGDTKPAVENQIYPWLRTTDMQWYQFSGSWRRPRPLIEQDPFYRIWWAGSEANIPTVGGGSAGPVTDMSGPFWERDTAFDGRSPMCPGEIPSANPAKTLAVGEDYGEGAHTMTVPELATHNHFPRDGFAAFSGFVSVGQPSSYEIEGGSEIERAGTTGDTGSSEPMPVIHPVRGIFLLKPTTRLYIVIP